MPALLQKLAQRFCLVIAMGLSLATQAQLPQVTVLPTPDRGVQPRLLNDEAGNIHLLYFKKKLRSPSAREGDLFYRQYRTETGSWSPPVKVSSQAFNMQTFSISRAGFDIDGEGRLHAVWYLPRSAQYFYSRSNPQRTAFEPAKSMVVDYVEGIDAGADVAARGNRVAIAWGAGDLSRESERTVYVRLSENNGASFSQEMQLGDTSLGACACCSLAMDFDVNDNLVVAYRSAIDGIGRHMQILTADTTKKLEEIYYGEVFAHQQWEMSACPLSTNDIVWATPQQDWLVFETVNRIMHMNLSSYLPPQQVAEPATPTRQKNPAMAVNVQGQRLVVWGESISHSKGGKLNMSLFDVDNAIQPLEFDAVEIPTFSFPAAAALADGSFLVLY